LPPLPHNADRFNAFKKRIDVRQSLWRLSESYVDRILRGVNPVDLPLQAPTKYKTVVKLKIAKALGLDVPSSLPVRADG
jgi:putative tryptophan/tyrosine transport system substrate-binding protein